LQTVLSLGDRARCYAVWITLCFTSAPRMIA
jgi:hypothetical protein